MKRINLSSMLRVLAALMFVSILISCSSSSSDDWPKLEADRLWQELDQEQVEAEIASDNSSFDNTETILSSSSVSSSPISLSDINASLNEIERKLIVHEKNVKLAVDKFENASSEDKDLHWRGIEIEKSRLNGDIGTLRNILYQLANNQEAESERKRATELLKSAEELMPDIIYNVSIE